MINNLKGYDKEEVEFFISYVDQLKNAKAKNRQTQQWENKNPWAIKKQDNYFIDLFKKNALTKIKFDGKHIIITSRGLSYDYIAYKNRLLIAYPETEISFSEVYKDDTFSFGQTEKGVTYSHHFGNPFDRNTNDIIGAYCVIKNKRGHFITLLDAKEIQKHQSKATTQNIWNQWKVEMILKTIIKKGTRIHYEDIYIEMNEEDNKEIDLDRKDTNTETMTSVDIAKLAQKKGIEIDVICQNYGVKELKLLTEEQIIKAYNKLQLTKDK